MKIKRFVALALIALLVVGVMGVISLRVLAQGGVFQSQACGQKEVNDTEEQSAIETNDVEEQCSDQNAPDQQDGNEQEDIEAAPSGTPAITVDQAQTAALAVHPGNVHAVELDEENGKLVYGVEFEGGVDVKVDAMTGEILGTETGQD